MGILYYGQQLTPTTFGISSITGPTGSPQSVVPGIEGPYSSGAGHRYLRSTLREATGRTGISCGKRMAQRPQCSLILMMLAVALILMI